MGAAIALLTGASSVVILLMAGLVAMIAAVGAAPLRLRDVVVAAVELPVVATSGEPLTATVEVTSRWPVHVTLRMPGHGTMASGWCRGERTTLAGAGPGRGRWEHVDVVVAGAGRLGLFWWRRTFVCHCDPMWVAPAAATERAPTVPFADEATGDAPGAGARPRRTGQRAPVARR